MAKYYLSYFIIGIILLLSGCQKDEGILDEKSSRIIVRLTDAPFPHSKVSEVNVTISKVTLLAGSDLVDTEQQATDQISIMEKTITVNLLELTNGITLTLANKEIPSGAYQGIYLYLEKANIKLIDDTIFHLNIGTRLHHEADIFIPFQFVSKSGLTADLLLDFDVSRSFLPRMSSGANLGIAGFIFNPVIKASDNASSGTLSGIITATNAEQISRLQGAQVSVYVGNTLYTTTFTDFSGMYTVLGLKPATYDIVVDYEGFDQYIHKGVQIKATQETRQSISLVSAY